MGPSTKAWLGAAVAVSVAILGAGCSSSSDDSSASTTTSTATGPTTTTLTTVTTGGEPVDVSSGDLPPTPISSILKLTSRYDPLGQPVDFDETAFGIPAGSVTAAWYPVDGYWAVYFQGLTPEQAGDKCLESDGWRPDPDGGFGSVVPSPLPTTSASPYSAGACQAFTQVPTKLLTGSVTGTSFILPWRELPPGSLHLCGTNAVVLTSTIRSSHPGLLSAAIGQTLSDGSVQVMGGGRGAGYPGDRLPPAIDVSGCKTIG